MPIDWGADQKAIREKLVGTFENSYSEKSKTGVGKGEKGALTKFSSKKD